MILRPVDENGDMLPAQSSSSMLSGTEAVAELIRDRLSLYTGDWWENPALGNEVLQMLRDSRPTESDAQAISAYLSSYIRDTLGVTDVRNAVWSLVDRQLRYSCIAETNSGSVTINYEL